MGRQSCEREASLAPQAAALAVDDDDAVLVAQSAQCQANQCGGLAVP